VTAYHGGFAGEGPVVVQGVEVGVADAGVADVDEDFGGAGGRDGDFFVHDF